MMKRDGGGIETDGKNWALLEWEEKKKITTIFCNVWDK